MPGRQADQTGLVGLRKSNMYNSIASIRERLDAGEALYLMSSLYIMLQKKTWILKR